LIIGNLFIISHSQIAKEWKTIASGMELKFLNTGKTGQAGDSRVTVVRIDPGLWEIVFAGVNQPGGESIKTTREWCKSQKLTAAINAGMFSEDYSTHTGFLKFRGHTNSNFINSYKSVLAFDPIVGGDFPHFRIYDLDAPGITIKTILNDYRSAIQNLRIIKKPGINVWAQQERKWSEAAIGEDKSGRMLLIFSRKPYSMHDLADLLLSSGIGIVAAQHLEGGPEAQLYLKTGDAEIELSGSFETGYNENDENNYQLPIPNVIGIRPK